MAPRAITIKQRKFISAYVGKANGNATEAARMAGYSGNEYALATRGSELLKNRKIQNELSKNIATIDNSGLREVDNRITGYIHRLEQFAEIVKDRRADPTYGNTGEYGTEPGAASGWLGRRIRITRRFDKKTGDMVGETVDISYKFDAGLAKEMRELERQVAIELRQWAEKRELSGPNGQPISIHEIEILKQILPPEVLELDAIESGIPADDVQDAGDARSDAIVYDAITSRDAEPETAEFNGWGRITDFDDDD